MSSGRYPPSPGAASYCGGALRSVDIIDALEAKTGKPVITSNQALAWDAMRLAGNADRVEGFGRLLRDF
ncbi:MAG: hypothetical protein ACFE0S_07455 [Rhodospirillales bacterium]